MGKKKHVMMAITLPEDLVRELKLFAIKKYGKIRGYMSRIIADALREYLESHSEEGEKKKR